MWNLCAKVGEKLVPVPGGKFSGGSPRKKLLSAEYSGERTPTHVQKPIKQRVGPRHVTVQRRVCAGIWKYYRVGREARNPTFLSRDQQFASQTSGIRLMTTSSWP